MNKYFNKLLMPLVFVLGVSGFASCTDYLDKSPLTDISSTEAYKNFTNFQGFTEQLYSDLPLMTSCLSHNTWNWGEDELWENGETRLLAYHIDTGDFWAWNTCYYTWLHAGTSSGTSRGDKGYLYGQCWASIRKANLGIANLDLMTDATQEEKDLIAGQLYFFRGLYHFLLMQFWGGLPYVDYLIPADAVFDIARLKYQPTADKAALDFQKAADLLPVDWDSTTIGKATLGNNNMRINKIMALCYLGKNYLYAGSPLMNEESTGSATYNTDYCKKASEAFGEALSLCESTKRYELVPFSAYSQLFYTHASSQKMPGSATVNGHVYTESIFMENLLGNDYGSFAWNQVNDYRPPMLNSSGIKVYPTANYVDYFGMQNGLPIPDITQKDETTGSGYNPEYPWKNRDPRFYYNIIYDGVDCCLASHKVNGYEVKNATLYTGGYYRVSSNINKAARTGYMESKFISHIENIWDGYQYNNSVLLSLMRLADVYLMYAEATAEGYGSPTSHATAASDTLTALRAVNIVRNRAGVSNVASAYTGSTDAFMPELRRERAVELAFEGHRFNDLRRWKLFTEQPYTYKKAVYFTRASDYLESVGGTLGLNPQDGHVTGLYENTLVERQLVSKHYWLPFLKADVSLYSGFYQNPGW